MNGPNLGIEPTRYRSRLIPAVGRLYLSSAGSVLWQQSHVEQEINKLREPANTSLLPN
jgi:hypothetical protein